MTWWHPDRFAANRPMLEQRAVLLRAVRGFFDGQGFTEVETPALQVCPVMDLHIHGIAAMLRGPDMKAARTLYLHTSPEFAMKKLLVAGMERIYQICHVYRDAEDSSRHSAEFTMLEWYRAQAGYEDIMRDCVGLLRHCAKALSIAEYRHKDLSCNPFAEPEIISVADAFQKYAGIPLEPDVKAFFQAVRKMGVHCNADYNWDDLFFAVMMEKIEPKLGVGVPTILKDYPVHLASLARRKADNPRVAERFELYVCGLELGNAFGELTDAAEQRRRFESEMDAKEKLYGERYPVDGDFIAALEYGMPDSGGIAVGFDRLAMLATGAEKIEQVLWAGKP